MANRATIAPHPIPPMFVLNLLILLLVATRPTRSVTTELGHGRGEPPGSGQANAATTIASSTFSDIVSPSLELASRRDKTNGSHSPRLECSTLESNLLQSNSVLAFDCSNNNRVHQSGESFSMIVVVQEWGSGPGSKIDASHISIDSQQLSQEGKNLHYLIDLNRIPIDSEMLPSTDFPKNLVPDHRNANQFGDSSSRNLADWTASTSSNLDESRISIDGQQSLESIEGKSFDCRMENTINSQNQPLDVRENFVTNGFPKRSHKIVKFRNAKYLMGLRTLYRRLNWDLDEVKDFDSLCVFLGKGTNPEQDEFHNTVAMTEHIMKLLLLGKSKRDKVEVGQNNIEAPEIRLIAKAPSTLQKLILISNLVLKLVSGRRSICTILQTVIYFFKKTCIPVLQCLVKCCGKDMDLFQNRWGTCFKHILFGSKYCPGPGSNHNICGYQRMKIVRNPDNRDKDSGLLLDLNDLVVAISMSKTAKEKLKLCFEFTEKYESCGLKAQTVLRPYYNQSPRPIWGCFVHHCGQNADEWIRKWGPVFAHAQFGRRKCHGWESIQCGWSDRRFDIPARLGLRRKSTRDFLSTISKIQDQYHQFLNTKTASQMSPHPDLTTFVRRCRPIYNCFFRHCAGSVEEFIRRWGQSVHYSRFSRNCCPGPDKKKADICRYDSRSSQG